VRSGRGPIGHTLLRLWHRRASRSAQPQWRHLWLHSPAISKALEWLRPGLRPAQSVAVVTTDRRVDDLESERAERHRGFEFLRSGYS
jgi:hypothetical protein